MTPLPSGHPGDEFMLNVANAVEDDAARNGWTVDEAEKWLAPVLKEHRSSIARTPGLEGHHAAHLTL
jgi:hypothetical protein